MGCSKSKAVEPQPAPQPAPTLLEKAPDDSKPVAFRTKLGAVFPDFECETTAGRFRFHEFLDGDKAHPWTILITHPRAYAPVCTTELAIISSMLDDFKKKGVKVIGLTCDPVTDATEWSKDILAVKHKHTSVLGSFLERVENAVGANEELGFPIIADEKREAAAMLGLIDPQESLGVTTRALWLIDPNKTNRASVVFPPSTGRNIPEVLRLVESIYLTRDIRLATPADWKLKEKVIVGPAVSEEEAQKFANLQVKDLPSGKKYLRYVDCPIEPSSDAVAQPKNVPISNVSTSDFSIKIGATFPNFNCKTTDGDFNFYDYLERDPKWTILFSHPKAFTPVCTTELVACDGLVDKFMDKGVKLIGLSCDSVACNQEWIKDILALQPMDKEQLAFPLIADEKREIATLLGMLDPNERDGEGMPMPARALFFIGPDKRNRATILYPATSGRNFDEVLRMLLALKMTEEYHVSTPGNWELGGRVVLPASFSDEQVAGYKHVESKELPSQKHYLRYADSPELHANVDHEEEPQSLPASAMIVEPEESRQQPDRVEVSENVPLKKGWCC